MQLFLEKNWPFSSKVEFRLTVAFKAVFIVYALLEQLLSVAYVYMCYGLLHFIALYFLFRLYDSAIAIISLKAT